MSNAHPGKRSGSDGENGQLQALESGRGPVRFFQTDRGGMEEVRVEDTWTADELRGVSARVFLGTQRVQVRRGQLWLQKPPHGRHR